MSQAYPIKHLLEPFVVGGSVIGLKCQEGIVLGVDTLLSYGGLLKFKDVQKYEKIGQHSIIVSSGEYADFQEVTRRMRNLVNQSTLYDDKVKYSVKELMNYLAHICYQKRNSFNPYYNSIVIAGFKDDQSVLASVDLYGTLIKKDFIVTGFAKHYGLALIAYDWKPSLTAQQCKKIIRKAFEVLYLRDCHALDQIQFAVVKKDEIEILRPEKIETNWNFTDFKQRANQKLWQ